MTRPLIFALPGNETLAETLARGADMEIGDLAVHRFPDGETHVRLDTAVEGRSVVIVCTLDRPDEKLMPLIFSAAAARDLGAARIGLVAPYLAYMRQDRRFQPGEAITSIHFAGMLGSWIDWLVTVDPHLHRRHALSEIYPVPAAVVHAAQAIARWIGHEVQKPLLFGPDEESEQWVSEIARGANAPHVISQKVRHGDRHVEIHIPEITHWREHTPVLVDDIISTGHTMIETISHLKKAGLGAPVCIGVHGVFAGTSYIDLQNAGARSIVTCNTIPHVSNAIDISGLLSGPVTRLATS